MKTPSGVEDFRAVWLDDGSVQMIDQRALPHTFEIFRAETSDEIAFAIKDMVVRGAPSIGAAAAYGMAMSIINAEPLDQATNKILQTRPTAGDLFFAVRNVSE
ncbi:MAG: S-methyl-5-thioribose-1-phosphate isomerase, partial [Thermoplasmata archaeon]|nr:S-methyl-5-thioribose-1-phosphate isomerase [Thermoplasmata archaeon]